MEKNTGVLQTGEKTEKARSVGLLIGDLAESEDEQNRSNKTRCQSSSF